ncbi:MAG: hypothetical protein V4441_12855, partial [Pseudomonadota bacterium]
NAPLSRYKTSAKCSDDGHLQTKPGILIRRAVGLIHVIDTKWNGISSRVDDPTQGVLQSDVYQMMADALFYRVPCLTLLYPHHPRLGEEDAIHARLNKVAAGQLRQANDGGTRR